MDGMGAGTVCRDEQGYETTFPPGPSEHTRGTGWSVDRSGLTLIPKYPCVI